MHSHALQCMAIPLLSYVVKPQITIEDKYLIHCKAGHHIQNEKHLYSGFFFQEVHFEKLINLLGNC